MVKHCCSKHLVRSVRDSQAGFHKRVVVSPVESAPCDYCDQNAFWVVNPE